MSKKRVWPKEVPEIENCSALVKNENHTIVNIDINNASHLASINDSIITVNDRQMDRINLEDEKDADTSNVTGNKFSDIL